ncbi:hypothetical protein halTADL_1042 [Halohasta litchfieldiae]|uniref:Uncharacterized conserved protein n=1 Tax=Halohasta litchfieldiae TaxID=1073996 RepID=A0A1H6S7L2_9EURY|nr:CARDB domain-containing protein [Halohasta litchfieldiae]ATW87836.1 hypothetical protein halTADL_1042 [Halohasta litchfieldiae]SEI63921.1 Uncharacterized conserved protein [Halohasta litchfieldiae]
MNVRTLLIGAVLMMLLLAFGGVATGQEVFVRGEPDIEVYSPDNTVAPGQETEFILQLDNEGDVSQGQGTNRELVTTARNVIIEAEMDDDDAPITITSGKQSVGSVPDNQPTDVPLQIEVPNDAEPGTYDIDVEIDYRWSSKVSQNRRGGGPPTTHEQSTSKDYTVEIEVDDSARFRVTDINSTLRVGEEGDITGEIENIGGEDATNAEVQFPTDAENLFPQETAVAVGDIEAGESAEFRIPIEVGSEAEAVPKRFDLPVSFRDENGIRQTDDDPEFLADIAAERDAFTIEAADRSITAGSSTTVDFTITNNRNETVTDIEPKLFADTPLSSSNDEAFVQSLDAGESTTISFDLAASATTPKTYPVTVDIRYRDAGGDSQITDSYRLPIDVSQAEEGGLLGSFGTIIVSIISLLTVGGGYVWYRNQ